MNVFESDIVVHFWWKCRRVVPMSMTQHKQQQPKQSSEEIENKKKLRSR
jgi:hypothetical protein